MDPGFVEAGLDAIEVYHSRHDAAATTHYLPMAETLRLLVTGGSDYHGDAARSAPRPGACRCRPTAFERLAARVR